MLNLYRSSKLLSHWVAYSDHLGWVIFPAKPNGWAERRPYRGEPRELMRIPARLGFNTGFPHPEATPVLAIHEHVFAAVEAQVRRRVA